MQLNRVLGFLGISFMLSGCFAPRPGPEPTTAPLSEMADKERDPKRAASMRITEEGKKELIRSHFDRAVYQFSRAIDLDSTNPFPYFYLGLTRYRLGKYSTASDLFGHAADLFVEFKEWEAESWAYQGECLEKLKRLEDARKSYDRALNVAPHNERARAGLTRIGS